LGQAMHEYPPGRLKSWTLLTHTSDFHLWNGLAFRVLRFSTLFIRLIGFDDTQENGCFLKTDACVYFTSSCVSDVNMPNEQHKIHPKYFTVNLKWSTPRTNHFIGGF
jgi:hypothetical protein